MYHNSGQKVEMVTGSRTRDKIRQEVTGIISQTTQPSSGLSHATFHVPIAYSSGYCMSVISLCCMSCWLRKCMHLHVIPPTPFVPVYALAESVQPVQVQGTRK